MKIWQKDLLFDIFYPARCPICGQILHNSLPARRHPPKLYQLICKPCFYRLPFILESYCMTCGRSLENPLKEFCEDCRHYSHVFKEARAVFSYKGLVQASLYQLKYAGHKEYARFFAAVMAHCLGSWIHLRGITGIVPVPLHPSRLRTRSYNQANEIAVRLGEYLGLPVYPNLLVRNKKTIAQKELNRQQRMDNLSHAFCMNSHPFRHSSHRKRGTGSHPFNSGISTDLREWLGHETLLLVDDIFTTGATVDSAASALRQAGCHAVYVAAVAITG